jgi:metallo-beta-lactamase family protein
MLKVKFIGAVGSVTGSCHLIHYTRSNSLYMVDCGLYQNVRGQHERNKARGGADLGGINPSRIKAIFLTHAHMDHCGLIPRMYRLGFKGKVICTRLTANCIMEALRDTVRNVDSFDKDLYDREDVDAIEFYCPDDRDDFQLGFGYKVMDESDMFFIFSRTGHLAGAVAITFEVNVTTARRIRICFGGDLGPQVRSREDEGASLLRPVQYPKPNVDYLVLESTYGGKGERLPMSYPEKIANLSMVLERALSTDRGANPQVIMPSFTLGRTQDLIVDLAFLFTRTDFVARIGGRPPHLVVDSTLARAYSNYFRREFDNWWVKAKPGVPAERKMRFLNRGHHLFADHETTDVGRLLDQLFSGVGTRHVNVRSAEGSDFYLSYDKRTINDGPVIYLSSSGMCSSGPVMERMRSALRSRNATVVFVGYIPPVNDAAILKSKAASWKSESEVSAMCTDGPMFVEARRLEDFELSLSDVRASLVDLSDIYSGHADERGLCEYALMIDVPQRRSDYKPVRVILVHGEDKARAKLREALQGYGKEREIVGLTRTLEEVLTPTVSSGWYNLETASWESVVSNEPSWQQSLKLLAEASDLHEQIAKAWYSFKAFEGDMARQLEYIRKLEVTLDNLEEWRRRFAELRDHALGTADMVADPSSEDYDKSEIYLDSEDPEIAAAALLFGLKGKFTRAQARMAWADAVKTQHPDSNPNATDSEKAQMTERMCAINHAYQSVLLAAFSRLK